MSVRGGFHTLITSFQSVNEMFIFTDSSPGCPRVQQPRVVWDAAGVPALIPGLPLLKQPEVGCDVKKSHSTFSFFPFRVHCNTARGKRKKKKNTVSIRYNGSGSDTGPVVWCTRCCLLEKRLCVGKPGLQEQVTRLFKRNERIWYLWTTQSC